MSRKPQTSRVFFRVLEILYYALISGQVLTILVAFYIHQMVSIETGMDDAIYIFLFIVPLILIGGFSGSRFVFRKIVNASKNKPGLIEKMSLYRVALIVRYFLLEVPSFFSIVIYLLTGNLLFLGMAGLIVVLFFTLRPTRDKAVQDLELNPDEVQLINTPDVIITD
jgi:hypothetical protein